MCPCGARQYVKMIQRASAGNCNEVKPASVSSTWPVTDVFKHYPAHQARIAAAEKKYFETLRAAGKKDKSGD